jgi:hypothetical protein
MTKTFYFIFQFPFWWPYEHVWTQNPVQLLLLVFLGHGRKERQVHQPEELPADEVTDVVISIAKDRLESVDAGNIQIVEDVVSNVTITCSAENGAELVFLFICTSHGNTRHCLSAVPALVGTHLLYWLVDLQQVHRLPFLKHYIGMLSLSRVLNC